MYVFTYITLFTDEDSAQDSCPGSMLVGAYVLVKGSAGSDTACSSSTPHQHLRQIQQCQTDESFEPVFLTEVKPCCPQPPNKSQLSCNLCQLAPLHSMAPDMKCVTRSRSFKS